MRPWIHVGSISLFISIGLSAQQDTAKDDSIVEYISIKDRQILDAIIVDGDTIPVLVLDEILLLDRPTFSSEEASRGYYILQRKVMKVYSYAVIVKNKQDTLNLMLKNIKGRRNRKRYIKDFQNYLENSLEEELRKLTRSEGQILSKLIYRETGMTTYSLIKKYRSGWNAFWWNLVANYYDISLEIPYDPQNDEEDKLIETILRRAFLKDLMEEGVHLEATLNSLSRCEREEHVEILLAFNHSKLSPEEVKNKHYEQFKYYSRTNPH